MVYYTIDWSLKNQKKILKKGPGLKGLSYQPGQVYNYVYNLVLQL